MEQLLNVLLIPSANDAANVIAEDIAGSVESFASMMNTKAKEIGCENTNFVNPNGVHDENHYSTAYDLALIGRYAMKNDTFRRLVSTVRYILPTTNKYDKENRVFVNTNRLVNEKSGQYYKYSTGIKTGYTDAAGNCIVSSAKKDNMELICVIMGAGNDLTTDINKFDDCISLFNYGFGNYSYETLCKANDVFKVVSPRNASKDTKSLNVLYETDIDALVDTNTVSTDLLPEVHLDDNLKAPITRGSVVGSVSYTIDGINYTTNLIAGQDILANSTFSIIIKVVIVLFALYIFKRFFNRNNGRKKRSKGKRKKNSKSTRYSGSSYYRFGYN